MGLRLFRSSHPVIGFCTGWVKSADHERRCPFRFVQRLPACVVVRSRGSRQGQASNKPKRVPTIADRRSWSEICEVHETARGHVRTSIRLHGSIQISAPRQTAVLRAQNISVAFLISPHRTTILATASPSTRDGNCVEELGASSPRPRSKARNHPISHRAVDDFE
jgi:hypothetical protein